MKNINFINSILIALYCYYKEKYDVSYSIFSARVAFGVFFIILFIPPLYYSERLFNIEILQGILKLNLFAVFIFIVLPLLVIIGTLTIKKSEVESLTEEEIQKARKKGKRNIIIWLSVSGVIWVIRIIEHNLS